MSARETHEYEMNALKLQADFIKHDYIKANLKKFCKNSEAVKVIVRPAQTEGQMEENSYGQNIQCKFCPFN